MAEYTVHSKESWRRCAGELIDTMVSRPVMGADSKGAPEVLTGLQGLMHSGDGWVARCPADDDASPSLSISVGDDGRVLLYCHAGCTTDRVLENLGLALRDLGRLLLNLLAAVAEFELELIRERVEAGMDRARRQGKRIGRPRVTDRRGFNRRFGAILQRLVAGDISRRKAARELGIGIATLKRLIDAQAGGGAGH